jgi:pilus assembly protein CpaB
MNRRLVAILLAAFVIASACTYLIWRLLGNKMQAAHQPASTRVVAAGADIKLGTVLTQANLTTVDIAGPLPKGVILKPENAIGRGVIADLYQGEPILESRLAAPGSGGGLAATIPEGMRACAVKVDEVVGVAGFVTPGMHVDVMISGVPPGNQQAAADIGPQVKTILQNLSVLSAGTDIQKDAEGKPQQVQVVNLLVTPDQAQVLSLASNPQTRIQLVLRNPLDTKVNDVPGNAMANLFGAPPKPKAVAVAKAKPAPKPFTVEVFNGGKRSDVNFGTPEVKK